MPICIACTKTVKNILCLKTSRYQALRCGTWLSDGAGLLEAVPGLVVPEVHRTVVPAAHRHPVLVHRQRVHWGIVSAEILQKSETVARGRRVEKN